MDTNVFVVIPTIRSLAFLSSWKKEFSDCSLLIVEDHKDKQIETPCGAAKEVLHYDWRDIKKDFGKKEWIFSRHNAGIRSYGFWKAVTMGADIIVTLDDDCFPTGDGFIYNHLRNLSMAVPGRWVPTYPDPDFLYTRGIPYSIRKEKKVVISHGLWTNSIDLDAQTQLQHPHINLPLYPPVLQVIPSGAYFPLCSMNLAFAKEAAPIMYFPLMGKDPEGRPWGYDRFDDIWAGIFAKKIIDHLGLSAVSGSPFVEHKKASDPHKNLLKEKKGIAINEWLWKRADEVRLTKKTPADCYLELAINIRLPNKRYFNKLKEAMEIWANMFL
ncbi:hypothetical protein KKB64_00085 [Patescibacteria group bacterium]|nr:hypothetical protein [Patescibacteria group bacterium]MBU2459567.1 hypothetical protein [Patescibacteria group bacterium]MBU2544192.1 hypothetical protein [Patescibacteria group bacterium]